MCLFCGVLYTLSLFFYSLPLILFSIYKFNTKLVIRISGKPKLNFFRKFLWKKTSKNVFKIFCPTEETRNVLIEEKIFDKSKVFVLHDPIFSIKEIIEEDYISADESQIKDRITKELTYKKNICY